MASGITGWRTLDPNNPSTITVDGGPPATKIGLTVSGRVSCENILRARCLPGGSDYRLSVAGWDVPASGLLFRIKQPLLNIVSFCTNASVSKFINHLIGLRRSSHIFRLWQLLGWSCQHLCHWPGPERQLQEMCNYCSTVSFFARPTKRVRLTEFLYRAVRKRPGTTTTNSNGNIPE